MNIFVHVHRQYIFRAFIEFDTITKFIGKSLNGSTGILMGNLLKQQIKIIAQN